MAEIDVAQKLKTPIRIRRKRQSNQGGMSSVTGILASGALGFVLPGLTAYSIRSLAQDPKTQTTQLETYTWSQLGLQLLGTWGYGKATEWLGPSGNDSAIGAFRAGMYTSLSVTALGLLSKNASPETKRFLGVGGAFLSKGPQSGGSSPPKLDQSVDAHPKVDAKLIYDPISKRAAGFYTDTDGLIPITETLTASDKDSGAVFFLTSDRRILQRPNGRGIWFAKPQEGNLPLVDASGVDFSESSDEVGARVRMIAGPSSQAGLLVDIDKTTQLPYRTDETGAVLVKEPSNGVEYIALSQTGHPLGVRDGGVVSLTAKESPVLGCGGRPCGNPDCQDQGIPTAPMFRAQRFLP